MHPVIKEYFEKFHGKEVTLNETGQFYEVQTNGGGCFVIAIQYRAIKVLDRNGTFSSEIASLSDDDWVYPFNGHFNDEAKMLRLLNLRAFL